MQNSEGLHDLNISPYMSSSPASPDDGVAWKGVLKLLASATAFSLPSIRRLTTKNLPPVVSALILARLYPNPDMLEHLVLHLFRTFDEVGDSKRQWEL